MSINCQQKYAPKSLSEVVFNDPNNEHFMQAFANGTMPPPNLLLHGSNGNGKTAIASILLNQFSLRGWNILKETISQFLSHNSIRRYIDHCLHPAYYSSDARCAIAFHELDRYGKDLSKLWTAMDEIGERLVVIITTNRPADIPNALLSRCDKYEFSRITPTQFAPRAQGILAAEGLKMSTTDVEQYLMRFNGANSDARDYMRTLDKMIYLNKISQLPPLIKAAPKRPKFTVIP